jgi:hypothetical protein
VFGVNVWRSVTQKDAQLGALLTSNAQWIAMLLTPRRPESALKGSRAHSNERLTVDLYL